MLLALPGLARRIAGIAGRLELSGGRQFRRRSRSLFGSFTRSFQGSLFSGEPGGFCSLLLCLAGGDYGSALGSRGGFAFRGSRCPTR